MQCNQNTISKTDAWLCYFPMEVVQRLATVLRIKTQILVLQGPAQSGSATSLASFVPHPSYWPSTCHVPSTRVWVHVLHLSMMHFPSQVLLTLLVLRFQSEDSPLRNPVWSPDLVTSPLGTLLITWISPLCHLSPFEVTHYLVLFALCFL